MGREGRATCSSPTVRGLSTGTTVRTPRYIGGIAKEERPETARSNRPTLNRLSGLYRQSPPPLRSCASRSCTTVRRPRSRSRKSSRAARCRLLATTRDPPGFVGFRGGGGGQACRLRRFVLEIKQFGRELVKARLGYNEKATLCRQVYLLSVKITAVFFYVRCVVQLTAADDGMRKNTGGRLDHAFVSTEASQVLRSTGNRCSEADARIEYRRARCANIIADSWRNKGVLCTITRRALGKRTHRA